MEINRQEMEQAFHGSFEGDVKFGVMIKDRSYIGIGGPVDMLVVPGDPLSLRNAVVLFQEKRIPFMTLGGFSNVLARDEGIDGAVIILKSFERIEVLREGNQSAEVFVESGVPLQRLVRFCAERGYAGIEGLAGIPGTVGGAIRGNSGSFGYEMKDVVLTLAVMDSHGRLDRFKAEGLDFSYRSSGLGPGDIVLSANMHFRRDDAAVVTARTEQFMEEKRKSQPLSERSLGCVFRNPADQSAGKLIDEAGCKGLREGNIEVSALHANFFINRGEGTARDYLALMKKVESRVMDKFGVVLQPEIIVAGRK